MNKETPEYNQALEYTRKYSVPIGYTKPDAIGKGDIQIISQNNTIISLLETILDEIKSLKNRISKIEIENSYSQELENITNKISNLSLGKTPTKGLPSNKISKVIIK